MSALQAPPVKPTAADQSDVKALTDILGGPVVAERVGAGRNSRVYKVRCGTEEYAAKFYFGPTADGRDRLDVEFSSLDFMWRHGVRCVPQPLRADPARLVALYQYVAGQPIDAGRASTSELEQLLAFVEQLRRLCGELNARALPPAAEAFFAIEDVIRNVRARLERLQALDEVGPTYDTLRDFLRAEFCPALDGFAGQAQAAAPGELDWEYRTLSPSDLGFHNALRCDDGRAIFLDFEYFGWDDPAKTLCDAQLHPRMQLSGEHRRALAAGFDRIFGADPDWRRRIEALYPLFALKWCLIMLNEFRPEQMARRRYVDRSQDEAAVIQSRQLEAATATLRRIVQVQGRFPYWETKV